MISRRSVLISVLVLVLFGACVQKEPDRPTVEDQKVIQQHLLSSIPTPKFAVNADLEGYATYIGLDVDRDLIQPGTPFKLTHYWKVQKALPGWEIFVHLHDASKARFVNADHVPVYGHYSASQWKVGEIIRDEHTVTLPQDWSAPELHVLVGLWKGDQRLKPSAHGDGENRVLAGALKVQPAKMEFRSAQRLVAVRTKAPVNIDGKLDDAVWTIAKSSGPFVNTMTGQSAEVHTEVKTAWDDKFLYVAFSNTDDDVWSDFKKRDEALWTQEAVELFIDANRDGLDYVELQVNPNETIFDSYLPGYRQNQNDWNSNLIAKVTVDGTVNRRGDKDKGWIVEMAIPWKDTIGRGAYEMTFPPKAGDLWRVNFFRLDRPDEKRQFAAAWSAPLVGDFHKIDRFGELAFGDEMGQAIATVTNEPSPEAVPTEPSAAPQRGVPGTAVSSEQMKNAVQRMRGARQMEPGTDNKPSPAEMMNAAQQMMKMQQAQKEANAPAPTKP